MSSSRKRICQQETQFYNLKCIVVNNNILLLGKVEQHIYGNLLLSVYLLMLEEETNKTVFCNTVTNHNISLGLVLSLAFKH